jgi:hypothetical protein
MLAMLTDEREAPPKCVSIDFLARKLAARIGVKIPEFESLGEEGRILAKMQDATEHDYIDETLQRACRGVFRTFLNFPVWTRVTVLSILVILAFAGFIRRMLFWADLKRRQRYRALRGSLTLKDQRHQQQMKLSNEMMTKNEVTTNGECEDEGKQGS